MVILSWFKELGLVKELFNKKKVPINCWAKQVRRRIKIYYSVFNNFKLFSGYN